LIAVALFSFTSVGSEEGSFPELEPGLFLTPLV